MHERFEIKFTVGNNHLKRCPRKLVQSDAREIRTASSACPKRVRSLKALQRINNLAVHPVSKLKPSVSFKLKFCTQIRNGNKFLKSFDTVVFTSRIFREILKLSP